jgi:hypothetical protein
MSDLQLTRSRIWMILGIVMLVHSITGNWTVLPAYRNYLENGSSGGGSGRDYAYLWGATKTISWMLSFHLGAFFLALSALFAQGPSIRRFRQWFTGLGAIWIVLWCIPKLPGPYTAFFAGLGILIALSIALYFITTAREAHIERDLPDTQNWRIASYFFLAIATWDICGLGTVGGILHPTETTRLANQTLVVAQTTKLMIELLIGWGLLGVSGLIRTRRT